MKVLYLMRHGIAKDVGEDGIQRDIDRPLSDLGIERTTKAVQGLDRIMEIYPDVILSSPLLRATETAAICSAELKGSHRIVTDPMLEPGVPSVNVLEWVNNKDYTCMMLVGHMPDLAMLSGLALASHDVLDISFKKASVCCLRFYQTLEPGSGELEWHLQPRVLRQLAEGPLSS